jgi:pimeloyl-ACP methyl ester carboxylesterase
MDKQDEVIPGQARLSVVLVHGAFVDGSGWKAVYDRLSARGYEVLVVQHPTRSLGDDVACTERIIRKAKYPVILVGHSYGGAIVTEAGALPQVRTVVYIAAFVPDAGESVASLVENMAAEGAKAPVLPPQDGYMIVDPARFAGAFAADLGPGEARFMAAAQLPWGMDAVTGTVRHCAWRSKPVHYMVAARDAMIPPAAQRTMASRAGATVAEVDCSHAAMLVRPDEVAAFIASAAA